MSKTDGGVALFCELFPATTAKQERVLDLLRNAARGYYRQPAAKCTTWSYFTPTGRNKEPLVKGLEIYTAKSALTDQLQDETFFQPFRTIAETESLYAKPEVLTAWYQSAGFVSRARLAEPFGHGVLVSVSTMTGHDAEGAAMVLQLITKFGEWVEANEPEVLTYAIFTRPKAPSEVLLVARYKDQKAMMSHAKCKEHTDFVADLQKRKLLKGMDTSIWQEVEDSFVSNELPTLDEGQRTSRL